MQEKTRQQAPHARAEGLVSHETSDELLVYDLKRHKAHCLNRSAALVWKYCDGQTSVKELARRLGKEMDAPADEEVVWLALERLGKAHLLRERAVRLDGPAGLSRREVIRKLSMAAAIALPAVTSIIAPTAVQAATCLTSAMNMDPCSPAQCGLLCNSCMGNFACGQTGMAFTCTMTPVSC
ncbi:MAG TPA: PqqD family protein [Blastocatellia bacterium]|nr:PqqD family protein [Blastocatellia bacterium]